MELSIFLAKLIGLYFIIFAGILLIRPRLVETTLNQLVAQPLFGITFGILNLLAGLAIVIGHEVWELSWRVVITLLGFYALIKGFVELAFPGVLERWSAKSSERSYWFIVVALIVIGVYLTYSGFTA